MNKAFSVLAFVALVALVSGYVIEGDCVYYENAYGKLSQCPHTLTGFRNFVEVNATSKFSVTQDLDFAFGFDTSVAKPKQAWYWKQSVSHDVPAWCNVSRSLVCYSTNFSFSTNPNHAKCFNDSAGNSSLMWEHGFVNGWVANKTIEWFEWQRACLKKEYWDDWAPLQQFSTAQYAGKTWYIVTASFEPNETKRLRTQVDVQPNTAGKYDLVIKRHSDSWQYAFNNGLYALLDPWWHASWLYRKPLNISEGNGSDRFMEPFTLNFTGLSLSTNNCTKEPRLTANYSGGETEIDLMVVNDGGQTEANGNQWCELQFLVNMTTANNASYTEKNVTNYFVYYNNSLASDPSYSKLAAWNLSYHGDVNPVEEGWTYAPWDPCSSNYSYWNAGNMVWNANDTDAASRCRMRKTNHALGDLFTVEVRYKAISESGSAVYAAFGATASMYSSAFIEVNSTAVGVGDDGESMGSVGGYNYLTTSTTEFHTYRLVAQDSTDSYWLYMDGVLVVSGTNATSENANNHILMGQTIGGGLESWNGELDFFAFHPGGNYPPLTSTLGAQEGGGGGLEFNVTSVTYSSPVYETNETLYNVTIDYNATNVSTIWYGHLVYVGVEFNATKNDNGSTVYFSKTHPAKFLTGANNTAVAFYFSVHGNYSNGTAFVWNTSTYNQFVWYAWFWNAWTVSPTSLSAGQQALATMNTTRFYGTAVVSARIDWVGTNYSMTGYDVNFTRWNTAPEYATSFGAVGWLNVTHGYESRINMTTNISVTVSMPAIVACNATANQTIFNFTARDEESNATANFSMDATFWVWNALRTTNATYSANWTNVLYAEVCIYPNWASGQVDSIQQYYFSGYYPRNYFLDHANVSNESTQNISLFLANNSLTKNTLFSLKDANGLLLSGYTIVIERYYPATNVFETIAMMRTDSGGAGITYLVPNDASYIYVVVLDGVPVEIITPSAPIPCASTLSQCTKDLRLSNVLIGEYYQTAGQLAANCSWNPSTNLTVCIVSDGSGLSRTWRLTVTKLGLAENVVACAATLNTSSGVLTCPILEDGEYSVSLVALGSFSVVDSFTFVKGALTSLFGLDFVFLALLVILSVGFAAIGSPAAGVFFLSIGVAFAKLLGLLVISVGATIMVVALGILIAWKLRK